MTLADAVLAMLLAAHLHGTEEAVRKTARRCLRQLASDDQEDQEGQQEQKKQKGREEREERDQLIQVVIAESPYEAALRLAQNMNDTLASAPEPGEVSK